MKFLKFLFWTNFTSEKGNFEIILEIMRVLLIEVNINLLPSFSLVWLGSRNSSFSRRTTVSQDIFYSFLTSVFWIINDYFCYCLWLYVYRNMKLMLFVGWFVVFLLEYLFCWMFISPTHTYSMIKQVLNSPIPES